MLIDKLTEIFVEVDDFCLEFDAEIRHHLLDGTSRKRIRKSKLSDSEIITILIFFHSGCFRNFKHFYINYVLIHLDNEFPNAVSYNRFIELQQKVIVPLMLYLKLRGFGNCTGISFMDSTPIRVCKNKRIRNNKVFKNIAKIGKSTMGWFFGFKLHLIINEKGELLNFSLSKGNVDDRNEKIVSNMSENLFGKIFADKGYISKKLFQMLFSNGIHLFTGIKSNMKNHLMTLKDKILLRKRSVIETVNDELKNMCQVEHSRHRSINNFLINTISALTAYCFFPKKPAIKVDWHTDTHNQLFLF
jgi:hypothetical protein